MEQLSKALLEQAYNAFNTRNIDAALSVMDYDVDWPNGWEGGYLHGHDAVRAYWTRQWKEIDPTVKPVSFNENQKGQIEVEVHQTAKDLGGNVLFDEMIYHIYTFHDGKVKRMEIKRK